MHPVLQEVVDLVRAAYPDGVPAPEQTVVLAALSEGLAEENLGLVAEAALGMNRWDAINTAAGDRPSPALITEAERRLREVGWDPDD